MTIFISSAVHTIANWKTHPSASPHLPQERHDAGGESPADLRGGGTLDNGIVSKWRQREKLKTTSVALVMCLNIGEDDSQQGMRFGLTLGSRRLHHLNRTGSD